MDWKQSKYLLIVGLFVWLEFGLTSCDPKIRDRRYLDSTNVIFDNDSFNNYASQNEYESEKLPPASISSKDYDNITKGEKFDEKDKEQPKIEQLPKMPNLAPAASAMGSIYSFLIILGVGALIAVIVYLIISSKAANSQKNISNNINTSDVLDPEVLAKLEINSILNQYLNNGDYRMAVRMLYLQLLQKLYKAGYVLPSKEKTNLDFFYELQGNKLQNGFGKLTNIYEKAWYADADVTASAFNTVQYQYKNYMDTI